MLRLPRQDQEADWFGLVLLLRLISYLIQAAGLIMTGLFFMRMPALCLALAPNPASMGYCSQHLPLALFIAIALPRNLVLDPLNYWMGRSGIALTNRWTPIGSFRHRVVEWLRELDQRGLACAVLVAAAIPIPLIPGLTIYHFAGAARMDLRLMMALDFVGTMVAVSLYPLGIAAIMRL